MRPTKPYRIVPALLLPVLLFGAQAFGTEGPYEISVEEQRAAVPMLITYVLLALLFSFLCSVAQAVLLSITPSYIESMKEKRPERAALLKRLKQYNVDRSLAAILTLNTIAHTVGAIGAGAEATIRNLLRFESLKVADIMTPRTVIMALPEDMKISESLKHSA